MKKILMGIFLSLMMTFGMFTKEYTWGTTTRWNNNYPEVVKTMPSVESFLKECGIEKFEFTDAEEIDHDDIDAVIRYAEKVAATDQEMGQFIFFNDITDLFIIVNFDKSKITGKNTFVGYFAAKIEQYNNYLMD